MLRCPTPAAKISRRSRLAQECAKLDPTFEKAFAEEGLSEDLAEWRFGFQNGNSELEWWNTGMMRIGFFELRISI